MPWHFVAQLWDGRFTLDGRGNRVPAKFTVLFFDADAARLGVFREELGTSGFEGDFHFYDAIEPLADSLGRLSQVDAVVVTSDFPQSEGASIFRQVKWHQPDALRLLLAASPQTGSATRVPEAHRLIPAPPSIGAIRDAVERSVEIRRRLSDAGLRRVVDDIDVLPSPPAQVLRLNEVLAGPDPSVESIAEIVETDPAMTAKLLQLVNSGFFGLQSRITEVRRAVAYLGLETTRDLLSALELVRAFSTSSTELVGALEDLHAHSLSVAELARSLLQGARSPSHDAFTGGLLHDIGLFAILATLPDRFVALRDAVTNTATPLVECELDILGARHAHLGAYLLTRWGLPEHLVETVARSHDADFMSNRVLSPVHAVFVAEQVINFKNTSGAAWEGSILPDQSYLAALGLDTMVFDIIGRVEH